MSGTDFPQQHARTRRFTLGAPRSFVVSPDDQRVTFLRSTAGDDPVNRLWVFDRESGESKIVADPEVLLGHNQHDLPPEELARRERAREAGDGIVSYVCDPDVTKAIFAVAGRLFTTDLLTGETARLPSHDGVFDPRPDPTGSRVAYVASGSMYLTSLADGDRLLAGSDDGDVTYGVAEFVAAEEMRRSRGYWWNSTGDRLLVARVDTSAVPTWHIASPIDPATPPRQIRYPAAGTANATVRLEIHRLDDLAYDVDWNTAGEWEYLADASWAPMDEPMLVVQTRDQRTSAVLIVDPDSGACRERYRWQNEHWIDIVPGVPTSVAGKILTVEDRGPARRLVLDGEPLTGDELQIRQVIQADADGALVVASTDATEQHLFHVGLDGVVSQLSSASGNHHAVTRGGQLTVASFTSMDHDGALVTVLYDGEQIGTIDNLAETPSLTPSVSFHQGGGHQLHTAVLLPQGADRDTPLPVLLDPYGGPHAQRVQKARSQYGVSQWFADQGFLVIITDGRGTPGRGPDFERAVYGDLAEPVLEDQVIALDAVSADYPGADLNRVGIRGWSFGGYLAALAVLRRPDRFHAAVAGAPVTDWRLYDTHYTERYLGHPDQHPEHYERCNLISEAGKLTRPLMLIHGLADDNVVAAHTLGLSRALLEAGRPHQVLPLSGVTHMTPQQVVAENLVKLQAEFLRDALAP